MIDPDTPLSPAGLRKREQILALALRSSSRRRQRRLVVRCALGCAVALGALSLLLRMERGIRPAPIHVHLVEPGPSTPASTPVRASASAPAPPGFMAFHHKQEIVITSVQTDPRLTSQLAVHPTLQSIERIGDDQLLDELALAQKPAGLARIKGKTLLLFRNSPHGSIARAE